MDRLERNSVQYDEKLAKLEFDLEEKMHSNITEVFNTYQANESNLLNDLQQLQTSLQKLQGRNNQLQIQNSKLKHQMEMEKEKQSSEVEALNQNHIEDLARMEKGYESTLKSKTKEIQDLTQSYQKLKGQFRRMVEEQVEEMRQYGDQGSESNRKKNRNGLGTVRKLS